MLLFVVYTPVIFRIVGEDDGGELFTPEQYEEYKKKVLPMVRTNKQNNCTLLNLPK